MPKKAKKSPKLLENQQKNSTKAKKSYETTQNITNPF